MRVKYRCKVRSEVRLKYSFSLRSKHFEYEFEVDPNGQLTYVSAVAVVPDKGMWPKVRPSTVPGVSIDIEMKSPYRDLARREIRAAEGMLSLVGVHEIEFETAEESWLHDSPEEQAELQLFRASKSYGPRPVQEWPYTPFDLVARAFLAASAGMKIDTALSFFRKGRQDIVDRRYIEAIYDFLFMIETLYADGKFKSAQVEGALLRNSRLQSILEETIRDAGLHRVIARDNRILAAFRRDYVGKDAEAITRHLVDLRGFLHHHSSRRSDSWHPDEHVRFGADALFLQQVCLEVGFEVANPFWFDERVADEYKTQAIDAVTAGVIPPLRDA